MIAEYKDPKPGQLFGEEEVLKSQTHMSLILKNQRLFAAQRFFDWRRIPSVNANIGKWIVDNPLSVGGGTSFVNLMMVPDVSVSVCKYANTTDVIDISHSQSTTNINAIGAVTGRPGDRTWFGLATDDGPTIGYLHYNGSTWGTVARAAGAPAGAGTCQAMAYSPTLNRMVACWDNNTPEYNSSGTTWTQGNTVGFSIGEVLWGGSHFVGARSPTNSTQVAWSADGIAWDVTALGLTAPGTSLIAYDEGFGTWYLMGSDMSGGLVMLSSNSPNTSWNQIPSMTLPCTTTDEATSFIVAGQTIAIMIEGRLCISSDLGQTWQRCALPFDLTSANNYVRRAGGKAYVLTQTGIYMSTGSFAPFSETI